MTTRSRYVMLMPLMSAVEMQKRGVGDIGELELLALSAATLGTLDPDAVAQLKRAVTQPDAHERTM